LKFQYLFVTFLRQNINGERMKKDKGSIHNLFSMILLSWIVICFCVVMCVAKAGYVNQYLEDVLMQANLSAILIDPYHYGATGELVFSDVKQIKKVFEEFLNESMGEETYFKKLGIHGPVELLDFRLYEVTKAGILEVVCTREEAENTTHYDVGEVVLAPDGTNIESSAIYVQIAVPVEVGFGIQITSMKEHCVDVIVSEDWIYE